MGGSLPVCSRSGNSSVNGKVLNVLLELEKIFYHYLVCERKEDGRNGKTKCLGCLEVHNK